MTIPPLIPRPPRRTPTLTKKLDKSLLNSLSDLGTLPNRVEVIQYCATNKAYPPGWRILLNLPDFFMQETGGVGALPDPSRCKPYNSNWRKLPDDKIETLP